MAKGLFGREDGKGRGWKISISFLCLVGKKNGRKEIVICSNLLLYSYYIKNNFLTLAPYFPHFSTQFGGIKFCGLEEKTTPQKILFSLPFSLLLFPPFLKSPQANTLKKIGL
jgi:hypothetical protein